MMYDTPTALSMLSSSQVDCSHSPHAKCPAEQLYSWWSKGLPLQSLTCLKAVQCLGRLPGRLRLGACHMWHLIQGTQKPLSLGPSARSPERCNSHMSLVPGTGSNRSHDWHVHMGVQLCTALAGQVKCAPCPRVQATLWHCCIICEHAQSTQSTLPMSKRP